LRGAVPPPFLSAGRDNGPDVKIIRGGEEVNPPGDEASVPEPRSYFDNKVCQS
jgi:hypothetical protein